MSAKKKKWKRKLTGVTAEKERNEDHQNKDIAESPAAHGVYAIFL